MALTRKMIPYSALKNLQKLGQQEHKDDEFIGTETTNNVWKCEVEGKTCYYKESKSDKKILCLTNEVIAGRIATLVNKMTGDHYVTPDHFLVRDEDTNEIKGMLTTEIPHTSFLALEVKGSQTGLEATLHCKGFPIVIALCQLLFADPDTRNNVGINQNNCDLDTLIDDQGRSLKIAILDFGLANYDFLKTIKTNKPTLTPKEMGPKEKEPSALTPQEIGILPENYSGLDINSENICFGMLTQPIDHEIINGDIHDIEFLTLHAFGNDFNLFLNRIAEKNKPLVIEFITEFYKIRDVLPEIITKKFIEQIKDDLVGSDELSTSAQNDFNKNFELVSAHQLSRIQTLGEFLQKIKNSSTNDINILANQAQVAIKKALTYDIHSQESEIQTLVQKGFTDREIDLKIRKHLDRQSFTNEEIDNIMDNSINLISDEVQNIIIKQQFNSQELEKGYSENTDRKIQRIQRTIDVKTPFSIAEEHNPFIQCILKVATAKFNPPQLEESPRSSPIVFDRDITGITTENRTPESSPFSVSLSPISPNLSSRPSSASVSSISSISSTPSPGAWKPRRRSQQTPSSPIPLFFTAAMPPRDENDEKKSEILIKPEPSKNNKHGNESGSESENKSGNTPAR